MDQDLSERGVRLPHHLQGIAGNMKPGQQGVEGTFAAVLVFLCPFSTRCQMPLPHIRRIVISLHVFVCIVYKKKSELGERPLSKWHQRDRNIDRRHRAANYRKQKGDAGGLTSSNKLNTEMAGDSRSTQTRAVRANLEGSVLDGHPERVGK